MVSRTKVENAICLFLNFFNITLYLLIMVAIVFKCLDKDFSTIVIGIYTIFLAAFLIINELREFKISFDYFRFLATFRGRGLIMIFFGCLVLGINIIHIVTGALTLITGLFYIILSFLSNFPSPNPITVNWRNWNDFSAEGLDLPNPGSSNQRMSELHEKLKSPAPLLPSYTRTQKK